MRYGMCTDIATATRDRVEYELVERIKKSGFDFVEFPLMMIETLSDEEFEKLLSELKRLDLACDCSCNYFPGRIKVTGPEMNFATIDAYLEKAMLRASRMGVKKIVFGSNNSRNLPEGYPLDKGLDDFCKVLSEHCAPICKKYGIAVVIEPLRYTATNIVITVKDGYEVQSRVNKKEIQLLADIMHMNYNDEDLEILNKVKPVLHHVHICERDRILPEESYSEYLQKALEKLKEIGYDETISFESKGGVGPESIGKALALLKKQFA